MFIVIESTISRAAIGVAIPLPEYGIFETVNEVSLPDSITYPSFIIVGKNIYVVWNQEYGRSFYNKAARRMEGGRWNIYDLKIVDKIHGIKNPSPIAYNVADKKIYIISYFKDTANEKFQLLLEKYNNKLKLIDWAVISDNRYDYFNPQIYIDRVGKIYITSELIRDGKSLIVLLISDDYGKSWKIYELPVLSPENKFPVICGDYSNNTHILFQSF